MMTRCLGCMNEYDEAFGLCPYCGYEFGTPAENSLHMQPGSILFNRYIVGKVIGFGGFGVTYIAWDTTLKIRVAIKEYLPSEFATRAVGQTQVTIFSGNKTEQFHDGMLKFLDEAQRLMKFQNEQGIVHIYDSFEENNTAYIVMEYLDGETLTAYLERNGEIPVGEAIAMLTPIFTSLEHVHAVGIIHRDIAPDNIMITKDGQVKLIDFGAARYATTSHSRSLTVIIKAGYSPEEQYRSQGNQGAHTDVYALAAVLYRMVTGLTPPDAMERKAYLESRKKDSLVAPSKNCKISKNQENAILNAMNIRIEDRTKTAKEFLEQLNSKTPVQRVIGKVKTIDIWSWPVWVKIVVPVGSAVMIALFVLLFTGKFKFAGNLITDFTIGEGMSRVPSVINYSTGIAQDMLDGAKLSSIISGREISDNVPVNMVLRQSPSAGEVAEEGSTVELYVSSAAELEVEEGVMPDVSYYTEQEALESLEAIGVVVSVEEEFSSDVAEGLVIRADVGYGSPLAAGDKVTLYISKGSDPATNENDGSFKLNRSSLNLFVGDSITLSPSGGNGEITWDSSNPDVASVHNGEVTARAQGSTTITATCGDEAVTCAVTVADYTLTLSAESLSLFVGDHTTVSAHGAPSGATVSWSSSNTQVAAVSNGSINAVGSGTTTITASFSYGGISRSASCSVTVNEARVELSQSSLTMNIGDTKILSATVSPSGQSITWSSSNTDVATVSSSGKVTAVGSGMAAITASFKYGGATRSASCSVTVNKVQIELSQSSLTMNIGDTETLSATVSPSGQSVTWSSSNTNVATVSNSGTVSAVGSGTATITASFDYSQKKYSATCTVKIQEANLGIIVEAPNSVMDVGDTQALRIVATVNEVDSLNITSSDPDIVKVNSETATITAVSSGTATITATITLGERSGSSSCTVTVNESQLEAPFLSISANSIDEGDSATLSWTNVGSGVEYSIEYSANYADGMSGGFGRFDRTTSLTYTLKDLKAGEYNIYLIAFRGKQSVNSNKVLLTVKGETPDVSVSWEPDYSRLKISSFNATIALKVTVSGVSTTEISSVGAYLYDSSRNQLASAGETVDFSGRNDYFSIWYDINNRMEYSLSSSTKYLFRMYIVINGTTYTSGYYSFTTD